MPRWIEMDELANLRDVGGLPTTNGGETAMGRLLRSDNLQTLTAADVDRLIGLGVTDVVDLRSDFEREVLGPGPLSASAVVHHGHSFFREWREDVEVVDKALPWVGLEPSVTMDNPVAAHYLSYVLDRPDSVVAALRDVAAAEGAALVHCAAGKDRTGTLVAFALTLAGVDRDAIIADYAASSDRVEQVLARLLASDTYAENLRDRPLESHLSRPETMVAFLEHVDEAYGGVEALLERQGWTPEDTARLRRKLLPSPADGSPLG